MDSNSLTIDVFPKKKIKKKQSEWAEKFAEFVKKHSEQQN